VITLLFGTSMAIFSSNNGILNPGPHGFTEILYALASTTGNNGSAFAGLSTNTPFYNVLLGIVMLVNRYWTIILVLAIAGSLVKKNASPANNATLSTNSILFITFMICIIIAFCLLTYIPAVILGPMSDSISGIRLEQ
jgi:K+-transporting ATPase ATPase A chain